MSLKWCVVASGVSMGRLSRSVDDVTFLVSDCRCQWFIKVQTRHRAGLQGWVKRTYAPDRAALSVLQYCSCSPAVLDLVKSFTNNDINQYGEGEHWATRSASARKPSAQSIGLLRGMIRT